MTEKKPVSFYQHNGNKDTGFYQLLRRKDYHDQTL
jgi:hypothetical protein